MLYSVPAAHSVFLYSSSLKAVKENRLSLSSTEGHDVHTCLLLSLSGVTVRWRTESAEHKEKLKPSEPSGAKAVSDTLGPTSSEQSNLVCFPPETLMLTF